MTLTRIALLLPLVASLAACGDAVSTSPATADGGAQDGAVGADAASSIGAAWCVRNPMLSSDGLRCTSAWPPASEPTRAPRVGCLVLWSMHTIEYCIADAMFSERDLAFLATCDVSRFPVQPCARTLGAEHACIDRYVNAEFVRHVMLNAVTTRRCW